MTLVIMAAGMGSRFGGLKQIEPVGPNGEFIIDYSIFDAIKTGFDKVVFIIKEENYDIFKETIGKRIEGKIEVEYVFQKNDSFLGNYKYPEGRKKPWGTAHAILCCKDKVNENFAIINADDFYGRESYEVISKFLKENHDSSTYAMVGYKIKNTISDNGSVKRGICEEKDGNLVKIIESSITSESGKIVASPLDGSEPFEVTADEVTSMNMFGFTKEIFGYLETRFQEFLDKNKDDLSSCEYLIPAVVFDLIKEGKVKVNVLKTNARWLGITYKEDKEKVMSEIKKLHEDGIYPNKTWE